MATEHMMHLLSEAEQALAAIALPKADRSPRPTAFRPEDQREMRGPMREGERPKGAVAVRIEWGSTRGGAAELSELRAGTVLSLGNLAGNSVDILADGVLAARGEVLVVDGRIAVRVAEIVAGKWRN